MACTVCSCAMTLSLTSSDVFLCPSIHPCFVQVCNPTSISCCQLTKPVLQARKWLHHVRNVCVLLLSSLYFLFSFSFLCLSCTCVTYVLCLSSSSFHPFLLGLIQSSFLHVCSSDSFFLVCQLFFLPPIQVFFISILIICTTYSS